MKKLTREEKHAQCMREIRATLIVTAICCAWHIASAFILNGTGLYFLAMPAWISVSTFGTIVLALVGVWFLLKFVFVDFEYDDEQETEGMLNSTESCKSKYADQSGKITGDCESEYADRPEKGTEDYKSEYADQSGKITGYDENGTKDTNEEEKQI